MATPASELFGNNLQIKAWLDSMGASAPTVFVIATALLTALGMPRLVFCSLAGLAFGFAWGLAWSQLGTLLGAYGTFLFARWQGRDYILRRFPKINSWAKPMEKRGWMAVLLLRQLPVNGLTNDILLGISPISHLDFWIGSTIGFLPLGIAATLAGAVTEEAALGQWAERLSSHLELVLPGIKFSRSL